MDVGKLGIWYFFDNASSPDAAASAKRIESLGYDTLRLPETVGKNPLVLAAWLLANTTQLKVATGIANIYHREPTVSRALQYTLGELSDDRFMMAIGVSHKPLVEGVRKLEYGPPVATMALGATAATALGISDPLLRIRCKSSSRISCKFAMSSCIHGNRTRSMR